MRRFKWSLLWCAPAVLLAAAERSDAGPARSLHLNVGTVDTTALHNLKTDPAALLDAGQAYVIQLDGPMTARRAEELRQAGVALADYLPKHAYLADLSHTTPATLARLDCVVWVGRFQDAWKLDPELGRRPYLTPERRQMADRGDVPVILTLFAGRGGAAVREAIAAIPGAVVHWVEPVGPNVTISATLRREAVAGLAAVKDVQYIEEAPEITLRNSTTRWIIQSNVTNLTPIYDNGITGTGQIVGVMDGRVNRDHCAFRDAVNNTPGPAHRKIVAYNTTFGYDQHGTHVAGTAIGQDVNGATDDTRGIAYGGRLVYGGIPSFTDTAFYTAVQTAHNQGARLHTNSWGDDGTTSYNSLCRGIDRVSYDFEESLVLFAVTNLTTLKNPENAKNCLAVAASRDTPNQASHCSGGQGPTADGRRKPEIYAPGCSTLSATGSGSVCSIVGLTGTSMASPAVAGAGLLVRQYYTDGYYPTGVATPGDARIPSGALIKATLLNSAVDMTGMVGYPGAREGWGRALLGDALYFPGDSRKLLVPADIRNANGLSTGEVLEYSIAVMGSAEPLEVTLVWTEPPASATTGTADAVINDLDLEVLSPASTTYLGNAFSGGVSTTPGVKDAENNVEEVLLPSPAVGGWTVRVRGAAVAVGKQGFALVVTGDVSDVFPAPALSSITPGNGLSGGVVSITSLAGSNFRTSGTTTARLRKTGQPDIPATGLTVVNSTQITCTFDLTAAEPGVWDVEVTNPDAQSATLPAGFYVNLSCLRGDVNRDTLVDAGDISRFVQLLVDGGGGLPVERCAGDVNELVPNGLIDETDVPDFVDCLLNAGC